MPARLGHVVSDQSPWHTLWHSAARKHLKPLSGPKCEQIGTILAALERVGLLPEKLFRKCEFTSSLRYELVLGSYWACKLFLW